MARGGPALATRFTEKECANAYLMEVLSIVCSCVDGWIQYDTSLLLCKRTGWRGSSVYSLWRLLATVHAKQ